MDFIIVISGPRVVAQRDENGQIRYAMVGPLLGRMERALDRWKERKEANSADNLFFLLSGGNGRGSRPVTSATVMRQYLIDNEVPAYRIFTEDKAATTVENALLCFKLLRNYEMENGLMRVNQSEDIDFQIKSDYQYFGSIQDIEVITSNYHVQRTAFIFQHLKAFHGKDDWDLSFLGSEDNLDKERLVNEVVKEKKALDYYRSICHRYIL